MFPPICALKNLYVHHHFSDLCTKILFLNFWSYFSYKNHCFAIWFPEPKIWYFAWLSSFSKSTCYLESTYYGEFLDAKIFSDKIGPESGFALKRWFYNIFLNSWYKFLQNHQKLMFFMTLTFPDTGIRFFGELSSFSKSTYLDST